MIGLRKMAAEEPVRLGLFVLGVAWVVWTMLVGDLDGTERAIRAVTGFVGLQGTGEVIRTRTQPYDPPDVEAEYEARAEIEGDI